MRSTALDNSIHLGKMGSVTPEWRNWQTRYVQGVVRVPSSGFKSQLRHTRSPRLAWGFFVHSERDDEESTALANLEIALFLACCTGAAGSAAASRLQGAPGL